MGLKNMDGMEETIWYVFSDIFHQILDYLETCETGSVKSGPRLLNHARETPQEDVLTCSCADRSRILGFNREARKRGSMARDLRRRPWTVR